MNNPVLRVIVSIIQKIITIINVVLILIIVLNILNIVLLKVQKRDYTTFLDYTYIIIENDEEYFDYHEGDFILTDIRRSAAKEDMVLFLDDDNVEIGEVTVIGTEDVIIESKGKEITVNKEFIIGTVVAVIPVLGSILNVILDLTTLWISIGILVITSIIQTLLNKANKKIRKEKPDLVKNSQNDTQ